MWACLVVAGGCWSQVCHVTRSGPKIVVLLYEDLRVTESTEVKRLRWHSRRGMLELDVLFLPFIDNAYIHLSAERQHAYAKLLECEDSDLFAYFLEREVPKDPELADIVEVVLAHARQA